jgi:RNA polymerase sigma-70 factor (family 1)
MLSANSEKQLWGDILAGDTRAFRDLFDHYWEPFFQYAYKVLQCREDAEEVVQELFIHIWNKRCELPAADSPAAYLFTALRRRLLNHLAKRKVFFTGLEQLKDQVSYFSASEPLERKSAETLIRSLARSLPAKMQQAYILHQFKGLSIAEIAETTGHSEQTIRNQVNTAIKKLSSACRTSLLCLPALALLFSRYFGG